MAQHYWDFSGFKVLLEKRLQAVTEKALKQLHLVLYSQPFLGQEALLLTVWASVTS